MEWIDVREKLPDESERVLLFTPYPIFGGDYSCVGNRESIKTCTTRIGKKEAPVFTHWMPLPPKPDSGAITNS
ncbi:MAG: DUF551 domain-containing protein [Desulfuromonadales bacterium]